MTLTKDQPLKKARFKWFYSLRNRFILLISGILIVIFALIAFFLIDNVHKTLTTNLNRESTAFASLSASPIGNAYQTYSQSGSLLISQQMQNFTTLDSDVSNVAVVGLSGKSVFSLNGGSVVIPASEASNFAATSKKNSEGQIIQIVQPYFDGSGQHSYAVVYSISTKSLNQAISREELLVLIFTILALFVSATFSYIFINGLFLVPLEKVSSSAQVIASGYYNEQIESNRKDEIGTLASSLNRMANVLKNDINKLEEVDKLKTEFITIASHNLRTPIAIIQGYIDMLKDLPDPNLKVAVESIDKSAKDLNDFTEQMLTIADVDSIRSPAFLEDITLKQLLQPLANDFAQIARTKGIGFKSSVESADTHINVNHRQLASAIHNLLDNAIKFTKSGGAISFEGSADNTSAIIRVTDNGIGIDSSEFPKMFTKFHRGTDTLHYDFKGVGIGLYLSKLIVEQHGGNISFESQLGKGSTFTIKIPILKLPIPKSTKTS